jgi:hypothetical protein
MKQETLEEAAERFVDCFEFGFAHPRRVAKNAFINGAKWQQEQDKNKFSDEDMKLAFESGKSIAKGCYTQNQRDTSFKEWFEQFKNK